MDNLNNYRPISKLSIMAKILEKVSYPQLSTFFKQKFNQFQSPQYWNCISESSEWY